MHVYHITSGPVLTITQQFTVDKEALKVEDMAVARERTPRRTTRTSVLSSGPPIPRPFGGSSRTTSSLILPGPSSPASPSRPFQADKPEGKSPTLLATDPFGPPDAELELERTPTQVEDDKDESNDREVDIYADAVLACSIANPEACDMCSG